jgi:carbon monoxide dehydrogenase subunit G
MPYEATVPVHRRLLWPAVTDPERLLGALPNAVIDASGAQGVAGRLKVRMREQTVTFRGVARIVEVVPSSLRVALEIEAVFGRAGGTVEGVIEIVLRQSGPGTRIVVSGQLDLSPGAAPLPAGSLETAIGRVVHRWFATLAESSPANRPDRTDDQSAQEAPHATEQRASLAVVRDMPVDNGSASTAAAPVPAAPVSPLPPEPMLPVKTGEDSVPDSDAAADPQSPAAMLAPAPAPVPLRLVTPQQDETPPEEDDDPEESLPEPEDSAEPEPEDIWSRLRDRGLPPWIPFLVGAASATLAALVFLLSALRRRQRR